MYFVLSPVSYSLLIIFHCCNPLFSSIYLGLNNKINPTEWKFLNKESYQFANWGRFQPNTRGRNVNKHCVQVGKNKTWRNKRCDTTTKRFICEGIPNTRSDQPKRSRSRRRHKYNRFY